MSRPLLLDLFCCEGGAAMGYYRAGFDVVGVDIRPQPRYPFTFVEGDALDYLREHGHLFDAIHASPPCHDHSALKSLHGFDGTGRLLDETRIALSAFNVPTVLENVPLAPMVEPIVLCGSMFGLAATCRDGVRRDLRRHRQFETNFGLVPPSECRHDQPVVGVYGNGGGGQMTRGYKATKAEAEECLGIDWMTRKGLSQAIPPAYTEYIGGTVLAFMEFARQPVAA